jgi:DNA-binding MarR family transcriptional regulator
MSSTEPADRLPIGQLLVNLLRLFRAELAARGETSSAVEGIRPAHLQVFGTIKAGGGRLTELASAAGLSLSAMAELVDDLESLGYLERRPDPLDGRAKLVRLTDAGWQAIRTGRTIIATIEDEWAKRVGRERFETLCSSMQDLLDELDPRIRQGYSNPPEQRDSSAVNSRPATRIDHR